MPTGSFAPDSPSRIVPTRPDTSRLPRTEKTAAGSVGESAAPTRSESCQPKPSSECATTTIAAAVTAVPATPSHTIGTAEARNRRQPMPIPPSKRTKTRATETTRSSRARPASVTFGSHSAATAAATRKKTGAGIRAQRLSFCEITARTTAPAPTQTRTEHETSVTTAAPSGQEGTTCRPGFPAHRLQPTGPSATVRPAQQERIRDPLAFGPPEQRNSCETQHLCRYNDRSISPALPM